MRSCQILSLPELPGSRMILPHPDLDLDPAKSYGSDRIAIHNTGCRPLDCSPICSLLGFGFAHCSMNELDLCKPTGLLQTPVSLKSYTSQGLCRFVWQKRIIFYGCDLKNQGLLHFSSSTICSTYRWVTMTSFAPLASASIVDGLQCRRVSSAFDIVDGTVSRDYKALH